MPGLRMRLLAATLLSSGTLFLLPQDSEAATVSGQRVFLSADETLRLADLNFTIPVTLLGAEGAETAILGNSVDVTLDSNIERLELPGAFNDYSISTQGTVVTLTANVAPSVTIRGLNQTISLQFTDREVALSLTGLNQVSTETTNQFYTVSGSVTGLAGSLTLSNNGADTLTLTGSGNFTFSEHFNTGAIYNVTIDSMPSGQICSVSQGQGEVGTQDITDVSVLCTASNITVSLSGTISTKTGTDVDSDINDPQATANVSNNSAANAQALTNFVTVSGYASAQGSFGTSRNLNDRFALTPDRSDFYAVNLQANQEIRLQVVDFSGKDLFTGDLDLTLYDEQLNIVDFSLSTDEFESVSVPANGNYFIEVSAFNGISKYILQLNAVTSSGADASTLPDFMPGEAIVQFKSDPGFQAQATNGSTSLSTQQVDSLDQSGIHTTHTQTARATLASWNTDAGFNAASATEKEQELAKANPAALKKWQTLMKIKQLSLRDDVAYAEPNYLRHPMKVPNDQYYNLQWHYPAINLPEAWEVTTGTPASGQVIVGVIDTGVFLEHADLQGQLVDGYDFISDARNARDGNGIDPNADDPGDSAQLNSSSWHGTHVAGTVAAMSDNDIGIAGVAWGARIMPLRVLGQFGGTDYDINQAMLFSAGLSNDSGTVPAQKADIINMSLGGGGYSQSAQNTITSVRNAGVIIIAAAGNENTSQLSYPASYDGVISVSATDYNGDRAPYSNFGSRIDVAAPGGDTGSDNNQDGYADGVLSTIVDDSQGTRKSTLSFYQGTSMATPHMAGVVALMKAVYPDLSPTDVDTLLASGAITTDAGVSGRDNIYGHGIIDAFKAVQAAQDLASGGTAMLPAVVTASPNSLSLGGSDSATITLSNAGGQTVSIATVEDNASWLSVSANNTDAEGLGTYLVTIDRSGLSDSSYTGTITFTLSDANTVKVQVSMTVGTTSVTVNPGRLYILLLDEDRNTVQQATPQNLGDGVYSYRFSGVSPGTYSIAGGSDVDNDTFICTLGETCGGYPIISDLNTVEVTNLNLENLDFISEVLSTFGATAQGHSGNHEEARPKLQRQIEVKQVAR